MRPRRRSSAGMSYYNSCSLSCSFLAVDLLSLFRFNVSSRLPFINIILNALGTIAGFLLGLGSPG